ncbi:hypothetical protein AB205_0011140 [Aquarana catesbeiana]|uniref:Uncharacterized protein n=1 Tax=Aquarana catesbeiana TaxID=8400 RepID=A0A2G9RHC7_AQUCT|nr:hypothetical protein AB205_0011140 [Aquarana catesbeiana]
MGRRKTVGVCCSPPPSISSETRWKVRTKSYIHNHLGAKEQKNKV